MNAILRKSVSLMACCAVLIMLSACVKKVKPPEGPPKPPWSQAMYDKYDHETFATTVQANTRIITRYLDIPLLNAAVFYESNRQRVANGLKPFMHSPGLEKVAREHSQDMVDLDFFSSESPRTGKKTLKDRMAAIGIENANLAENLGVGTVLEYEPGKPVFTPKQNKKDFFSYKHRGDPIPNHTYIGFAKALVAFWMSSPENKRPFLNPDLTYMGAGGELYIEDEVWEKLKYTQLFASEKGLQ